MKSTADLMNSSGLVAAGYRYLVLDDCWEAMERDAAGSLVANNVTFPSGIAALADYVHERGLLFGLYTDAGMLTCEGRPGSYGFEAADMAQFAAWGVDYVKIDWCHMPANIDPAARLAAFRDGVARTGRPMVVSACVSGARPPALWVQPYANLWRTTTDIKPDMEHILKNLDGTDRWAQFAGPGAWNDPDMLVAGLGNLTFPQTRAHFALWAAMKAPLMLALPDAQMTPQGDPELLALLTNPELLAINQDPAGIPARRVASTFELAPSAVFHPYRTSSCRFPLHLSSCPTRSARRVPYMCGRREEGGLHAAATGCAGGLWSQGWRFEGVAGGAAGRLIRDADGMCMFASGCWANAGAVNNVAVLPCDSSPALSCAEGLLWSWSGPGGSLTNAAAGPGQCLEVRQPMNKWQPAGPVVRLVNCSWPTPEPGNRQWDLNPLPNGTISVRAGTADPYSPDVPGQLCLDSTGAVPPGAAEIWAGPLADDGDLQRWAVVLFYRTDGLAADAPKTIAAAATWPLIGWGMEALPADAAVSARDVLGRTDLPLRTGGGIGSVVLAQDDVAVFVLSYPRPQQRFPVAIVVVLSIIGLCVICLSVLVCRYRKARPAHRDSILQSDATDSAATY